MLTPRFSRGKGRGWAVLELTDALPRELSNPVSRFHHNEWKNYVNKYALAVGIF